MDSYQAVIHWPCCALGIVCSDTAVEQVEFLPLATPASPAREPLAAEVVRQLQAYLADPRFAFDLPLAGQGTPFQQRVWAQIATIPVGQTRSYGDLARTLHSAARAVGGACGCNPLPVLVPCHRVVASDGRLGGFNQQHEGEMLQIKRWLLAHEQPLALFQP